MKPKSKTPPEGMRPIGARLLKSVSDTLRPHLPETSVLDLFAGQGRFGFQALLEGASHVTFVEKDRGMCEELKKTAKSGPYKNFSTQVLQCDAFKFLKSPDASYDIVFADPPFKDWNDSWLNSLLTVLPKALKLEAILLVKCPSEMVISSEFESFTFWKETEVGESKVLYYTYGKEKPEKV